MKVLVLTNQWPRPDLPYCGVMVVRQVGSLASAGVEAEVISIDGRLASYLSAAGQMLRINLRPGEHDVVHAHTGHSGVLACLQVRHPVVLTYVGYDLDVPAEDREGPRTKFERLIFRQLSRFIAATVAKTARGRSHLPTPALKRNAVIPNGVDRELFAPTPRAEARRGLGWDDAPVALFAADPSRFTKCFELAEKAVTHARHRLPSLQLRVCHDVRSDDVPLWMNAADVLLLTSVAEGSPNVVKEAMACDLPVVSVDVGDVREIVEGTRHCHICAPDPADLADALNNVISAIPERSDGRERSAHLDDQLIAQRLRALYERARTRGPGIFGFLPSWSRGRLRR